MPKIAVAQMTSGNNLVANFTQMRTLAGEAKKQGAELIAFPEMAYFVGKAKEWGPLLEKYDAFLEQLQKIAKEFSIHLVPGTLREPVKTTPERYFNTCLFIDNRGRIRAKYRKIFLYRASLPDQTYDEPKYCDPGSAVTTLELDGTVYGFAICFDLRFPELFRALRKRGAEIVFLPSAFTVPTGQAHWEPLLRARAIENQFFIVAPGQVGTLGDGNSTFGGSTIISPWGEEMAFVPPEPGIAIADLNTAAIQNAASKVNAWESRREDIFPVA